MTSDGRNARLLSPLLASKSEGSLKSQRVTWGWTEAGASAGPHLACFLSLQLGPPAGAACLGGEVQGPSWGCLSEGGGAGPPLGLLPFAVERRTSPRGRVGWVVGPALPGALRRFV